MNILVIGDTHAPFTKLGYLEFCRDVYKKYRCEHVIHIGDIIDNHYSSYHESDPDGLSAGHELEAAIASLEKWHKAFPNADVCLGNHDRLAFRKAFSVGLSSRWVRSINDVLHIPTWNIATSFTYDEVFYVHGDRRPTARASSLKLGRSVVQGHRHSEGYVWHHPGARTFGMQVGCGVEASSYAMEYAKETEPFIGCGVVLNNGTYPKVIPML